MDPEKADSDNSSSAADERRSSGWDIRNAPRNYFWLIVFQAGSAVFSFAAVWLITRHLGSEGYGGVVAVIAASQIAQVFVNWTGVAVIRFGVDEFVETQSIARTFWSRAFVLTANLGIVAAAAPYWYDAIADWLRLSHQELVLVILHLAATTFWVHLQMSMQAAKRLREQGFLQMLERLLIFAGLLLLVFVSALDLRSAITFYIAAPFLMAFIGLFNLRRVVFQKFTFSGEHIRKMLAYSLPLLPFTLVGFFTGSYIDAVFVSKMLSTRDLGVYSIATQFNGLAMQIPTLANTILLPMLVTLQAESGDQRSFHYFRHIMPGFVLIAGFGCSLIAFLGYMLIDPVFGGEFAPAAVPLWLLLSSTVLFIPIALGYSALANSTSATYIPMAAGISSAIVNVTANFVLIPRYGMIGCALATLIAYSVSVIIFAFLLRSGRKMPISWTFLAFIPSVTGAAVLLSLENAWLAIASCLVMSILVSIYKINSMRQLSAFILALRSR